MADFEDPFDLVGDVLDGQFRVDRFAGEGDFTVVYRGHHLGVDAPVAIKCLNVPPTLDAALLEPFLESFRDGARLHYRLALGNLHIARSIAFGTTMAPRTGQSVPYLVREWLEGCSLAADFEQRAKDGMRPRALREVIQLLESAAEALAFAHAQGVVHHSINPRNLFVVSTIEGRVVKVLDFGVAKLLNEHSVSTGVQASSAGLRVMFPSYCAPEQLDRRFGIPGASTDVYALALVIYEALSGSPVLPHNAQFADVLRTFNPEYRPTARSMGVDLPRQVEAVLTRALALEPSVRQGNAAEFWREMRGAARDDSSIKVRPRAHAARGSRRSIDTPSPSRPPLTTPSGMSSALREPPVTPHRPWLLPALAGAALAASALLWGSVLFRRTPPKQAPLEVAAASSARAEPAEETRQAAAESMQPTSMQSAAIADAGIISDAALVAPDGYDGTPQSLRPVHRKENFDRDEAVHALDQVAADLAGCETPGGPHGQGSIRVRFDNDGTVLHVTLGPPWAGTPVGACIAQRFQAIVISPYRSPSVALNYMFNIAAP